MSYEAKYLKYKEKYLTLKSQLKAKQMVQSGGKSNDNKLYLFKAEWCGHCKQFKSTWDKLQKEMANKIEFVTYDADTHKNEITEFGIQGFPTLVLKTGNKAIEYNGQRDIDSLKDFINIYNA